MSRFFAFVALLALAGCATCQRHPVACAVGGALIVGSIAASIENDHHDRPHDVPGPSNPCTTPEACR